MGWIALAVLGAATMGAMTLLRVPRPLWMFVGAALMLGAAGYALQGSPTMPGRGAVPDTRPMAEDPSIVDLRDRMFGRFTGDGAWVMAADAMARSGDQRAAVQALLAGIRHFPKSAELWAALGTAYVAHDGNRITPPAIFAFQQAMRLAPTHPGPFFFAGLADIGVGDFTGARRYWIRAVTLSPAGTSYRRDIAIRLALLDRLLTLQRAMMQRQPGR